MRTLPILGDLHQDEHVADWWASRPIPVPLFSGALLEFVVDVEAHDDKYPPDVGEAIRAFLRLDETDRLAASSRVCAYHREILDNARRRRMVEVMHLEPRQLNDPHDIWKFVQPRRVHVERHVARDGDIYVAVACECGWEPEHGLQLVYRRGVELVRAGAEDGHLND
jgi:hypothetical protein